MDDKEAFEYFLLEILANIKYEYRQDITIAESEDAYIIHRLHQIADYITKESKNV